ncbi:MULTISPECIES: hypothetical protein [unclassified Streptomyces]|uniref:hypothetical protein n=1 Tax=unclassified Streptomyces TaxID=2593676 RepID=UPI0036DFFCA8
MKHEPERKARAQEVESNERAAVNAEVARWKQESRKQQKQPAAFLPTPATVEPLDSGMARINLAEIALPSQTTLELADPEQARQLCADVVAGLVRSIAGEAESHAAALRPLAAAGCCAGRYRTRGRQGWGPIQQGWRLTPKTEEAVYRAVAWAEARNALLSPLHHQVEAAIRPILTRGSTLQRWRDDDDTAYEPSGTPVRAAGEWGEFLQCLVEDLAAVARRLHALPSYEPPPGLSPPRVARLREDTVAEAVEDRIFEYVEKQSRRFLATPPHGFSMAVPTWDAGARLLTDFLTADVLQRFERTTVGFQAVSRWDDTSAAPVVRSRMHRIFVTFALNYMVEVLNSMPEYADHSGENTQKNGITIQAGVVQIANTLNVIGSNVAAVMQRGDTESAEAVNALSAAVQADQNLDPQSRAEQLENVADVAAAVADPDADGSRRRGRNALAAITAAAGASSQITQAIEQWQHIFASLR